MKSTNDTQDVVVIGGGPAGSTAASFLAMKGYQVTVLEKEKFPRDHVGESLLPFCYAIFEKLGLLEEMTKRFVRKPGVRFVDSNGERATSWCFNHVIHDPSFLSFQVARSDFDKLLLDNSRKHGATVKEQTRVQDVDLDGPDGTVIVQAVGPRGGQQTHRAKFLIDASGRNAFLATRNRWRKQFEGLDRTALWTHWHGVNLLGGLEEGLSLIVYLGGDKKGWIWVFPLGPDHLTVGVVLNNEYIREQRAKLQKNGTEDWKFGLYCQELMYSSFVEKILAGGRPDQPLRVEGDYSYYVEKEMKYGSNFALIGDASTFIDPIFSSGVFLAMNGGRLVAEGIHEKLTKAGPEGVDTLAPAYAKINGAYGIVHKLIRLYYNPHAVSFAEAGTAIGLDHVNHENAMAAGHFLLAGDFFERHEEYGKFMDLLESPTHFGRYRRTVINRKEFQSASCGASELDIFPLSPSVPKQR
jgi:hypothetical protein